MEWRVLTVRVLSIAAVAIAGGGCLNGPGYDKTSYACVESPICPTGFSCVAGVCTQDPMGPDMATDENFVSLSGIFMMGCVDGSPDCMSNWVEHEVELRPYEIQKREVSQAEYDVCVKAGQCMAPAANYDPDLRPDAPVRNVSWPMAHTYCMANGMELPTEAQWERAARASAGVYPWGTAAADCDHANFDICTPVGTQDVGTLSASANGMFHVAGNVREWVFDFFKDDFYATSLRMDPVYATETGERVLRGGSFLSPELKLRVWYRDHADKVQVIADAGFRCVR
jgi:formylglycine-generating enzyme